ncbi:grsT [Symbiodinium necroappetens]|uniref:GrsT protein n=1 Tax=Symbiodinium necroappetens TaxID=1628268 RepID=A0A812KUM5_9DINO|nr:grsT [Symbiodinium necroappetens]
MAPDAAGASTLGTDSLLPDQKLDAILNQWREKYAAFQRATQTVGGQVIINDWFQRQMFRGIIVRCTSAVGSEQLPQRLETGAVVQELSMQGERLHYELISGVGPPQGWVSTSLQGRALLERADEKADEVEALPDESALPALSASKWLAKYEHGKEAKCRLVCFFGAGHDAIGFAHWNQYVAEKHPSIELLLITLPGHGVNRHVPVQENAEALAKLAAEELLSLSEHFGPFALLGFSVGATASKAGPKVCFRPPAQEEIWALDSIGWIRWFVANFATEDDVKRTERLIQLSDGPNDGLLKSISSSQKADMLLGDSLAGTKLPAIETDLYVLASKADEVWPAEDSAKYELFVVAWLARLRFGNRCCPAYMDCADTWKPYALGSTALKYFDELTHSELCTELLLEEVCRDLSAVMQDASDGRKDNACLSRAWKWLENDACTDGTWAAVASSAQKHQALHVLSTDATMTNSKPARVGASREASESDDEAFLRKIKQEVGLDVGPIWDSLPTPGGGSEGGSPIAAEADLYPLPVALEEDFRHLRAALAADAEPQVWQEGAEAETHDGDDDANTSGPHEAAAADERDKNAAQDEAAWIQPDHQTADAETGGGTAELEPKDQMLARLLALEAEVSRLREGAAPTASASPLSPEPSAESPRRPEERGGGVTERGEALLNSLAMSLLSSGSSLFASMSDGPTSPVWRQGTGAALSQQVEAEPVRDAIENRPQPKEERFEEEADGLVQQSRTLETAVQVPEFSAVAAAVQTEAEDTAEDTAIAKSEEQPSTLAEPMLPSNRQGADEEGASAQAGLPLEYSTEDPRQPTEAKPGAALQGLPASVNPEAGSGPLPSRTLPADSATRQAAASSAVPAARSRFELVAQLPADWPAGSSHPSELPMLPPHLPKLLQTSPQRDATHVQAQSGWRLFTCAGNALSALGRARQGGTCHWMFMSSGTGKPRGEQLFSGFVASSN